MFPFSIKKIFRYKLRKFIEKKPEFNKDKQFDFVEKLRNYGYCKKSNFIDENKLAKEIVNQFNEIPNLELKRIISENQKRQGRYNYRTLITNFFDKDLLNAYANQDIFIDNFRQYFGVKPVVRYISVWLDYPLNEDKLKNSQLYHRDYDDVYLVKTFLCLTDINDDNGPFQFISSSHKKPWKKSIDKKESNQVTLLAKKGDLYLADTNGFHKGKKLIKNFRCLVNVHYVSEKPFVNFPENIVN